MSKKDGIGKVLKREMVRAILERTQSMDTSKTMSLVGAKEPVIYEDVKETLNVAYINRDEVALAMDIFEPEADSGKELPVIMVIHGGGLFMGDRGINRPYCRLLAHKGYLVFSLEYRLAPKANLCEQLDDVCAGLDRVGSMLVDYDVDYSRMFLVADSAGAYLAAYVSAMHDSKKLQNAIGHKPSRMVYAAAGFICGMFYTNKALQEQIYDDKRHDEKFLKYMNIENPEIIGNMPPSFLITSCGDTFNNYSIKFNKALKKLDKTSKLVYLGNEELRHIFPIVDPEHPRSIEVTDKMLSWFEQQADIRRNMRKAETKLSGKRNDNFKNIESGNFGSMKVWKSLRERLLYDESMLDRTAITDCTGDYSYEQMYGEWERYAGVFSALDISAENKSKAALCGGICAETVFALFGLNMTGAEVSLYSYSDFLPAGNWKTMIEDEKVTDLIISDMLVTKEVLGEIEELRKDGVLRNVICIHSLIGGPTVGPAELTYNEINYHMLLRKSGLSFMDELLEKHKFAPVDYDEFTAKKTAFILHDKQKLLKLTDKAICDALDKNPKGLRSFIEGSDDGKPIRILQAFDFSLNAESITELCQVFAAGETLVTTFFGAKNPKFIRAIDYYNISSLTINDSLVERWIERTDIDDMDFSSLLLLKIYVGSENADKIEAYADFFKKHGYKYSITKDTLPDGMESSYDCYIYDLLDPYTSSEGNSFGGFNPIRALKMFKPAKKKGEGFKMPEIPAEVMELVMKYGNRVSGLSNGRRWIDHDFEE